MGGIIHQKLWYICKQNKPHQFSAAVHSGTSCNTPSPPAVDVPILCTSSAFFSLFLFLLQGVFSVLHRRWSLMTTTLLVLYLRTACVLLRALSSLSCSALLVSTYIELLEATTDFFMVADKRCWTHALLQTRHTR